MWTGADAVENHENGHIHDKIDEDEDEDDDDDVAATSLSEIGDSSGGLVEE